MTDRIQNLNVILDRDIREDDVQCIVEAISMIKYVTVVELGKPVDMTDHLARSRAVCDLGSKIINVIHEHPK